MHVLREASRRLRRRSHPRLTALLAATLVATVTIFGGVVSAGAIDVAGPNFEIDGDLVDFPVGDFEDWETVIPAPGVLIPDPHSKKFTDTNVFNSGGKFYDTATWNIGTGNVGASQNELTNVALYAVPAGESTDGHDWLVLSLERTKKQGTFALWFELNRVPWDGVGVPARSTGDLAIGFELSGNPSTADDFEMAVLAYDTSGPASLCTVAGGNVTPGTDPCPVFNGNWHYRYLGSAGDLGIIGAGQMNLGDVDPSSVTGWNSFDAQGNSRALIGPFQFAEAAIDLTALGVTVGCPGFGSAHAATVASLSSTADAKDLAGPADLPIDCSISGKKFEDVNVDGLFDAGDTGILNWPISLYLDGGDGVFGGDDTFIKSVHTDSSGAYSFDGLSDGIYHVMEGDAPEGGNAANWQHQAARTTDGTLDGLTRIINITINSTTPTSTGNDFLNAQPPDLRVSKTAASDPIEAGDTAEFTITVTNDGPGTATNVTLEDHLPVLATTDAWSISTPPASPVTCSIITSSNVAEWAATGPHDSGEEQHLSCSTASLAKDASFSVTIQATTTGEDCGTITNVVTVGAANEPTANVGTENTATDSIVVNCPNISVAKSGTISYTASVSNASGADVATADGVTLSDTLPGDLNWTVEAITDGSKCGGLEVGDAVGGGIISCSGIELAPGASFSVTVQANITDTTGDCTTVMIGNTASGTATNEAAADTSNNSDSAAICAP